MTFGETLRALPKTVVLSITVLMALVVGYFDAITAWDVSFFILYTIPVFFVAWTCDRKTAIGFTILCAAISWTVNLRGAPSISLHNLRSLNRLVAFSFVATAGIALRAQREHYLSRLAALEHSRQLEQEIIRVSESEQRKIGQDLHDSVCQSLAAIDCAAGLLKTRLESKASTDAKSAEEIQELLRKTLVETRSLARGIFPVQLEKDGLAVAIEELVGVANRLHDVPVTVEIDGDIAIKDPEISMHLYRIAQEALNNALRHAGATAISIALRQDDNRLTLAVQDNGRGIPDAPARGMGLRTIRYRTELIGGRVEIQGEPAKGTRVQCSIPLSHDRQN